jgi:3-methylfumaryl-CoA hydratase
MSTTIHADQSAAAPDYSGWVGRQEIARDVVTTGLIHRIEATLGDASAMPVATQALRPLGHWCLFNPETPQSEIGPDGHAQRGGFLPPVHHLPRRMWAGSRLSFTGAITAGMAVTRRSTIASVKERTGSTGALIFVTVRHEICEDGGALLVTDEHDIVYRGLGGPAQKPADAAPAGTWQRTIVPDDVLLFRYSALTFNGHRIHYDRRYVTEVEGYPGLIVHGPLIATLLLDLVGRQLPGARIASYSFRALSPAFDGHALIFNGEPPDADGRIRLWAARGDGGLAMQAEAILA